MSMMFDTGIEKVLCSCGGEPVKADPTEAEEKAHGCGRPGCCVKAIECPKCKTRFTLAIR